MELAHQQRVIAIVNGNGDHSRAVNIHCGTQRRLQRIRALDGKAFRPKGIGIDFEIDRAELYAGKALVFFSSWIATML